MRKKNIGKASINSSSSGSIVGKFYQIKLSEATIMKKRKSAGYIRPNTNSKKQIKRHKIRHWCSTHTWLGHTSKHTCWNHILHILTSKTEEKWNKLPQSYISTHSIVRLFYRRSKRQGKWMHEFDLILVNKINSISSIFNIMLDIYIIWASG